MGEWRFLNRTYVACGSQEVLGALLGCLGGLAY